ncbi:MAG: 2-polyprenyl-6-hydroxyphenyl methylase / 3-demethylubiquinone-9 3-methyltransferase [Frankiaceae bacterium]|jgi:2-polyprenyl-6-hydroxyphenyl methylase/3-demethylubiquinone-9 3-methyltransferase|nr:2-polyprenyl-6-hydroxyphenyl methylase / 3-demethylubiquinone-9 3-methyltransferase [Frankiaceae bacterium]
MGQDAYVPVLTRPRNDPGQYDDLAAEWWRPRGAFAPLHWVAKARGALVPPPRRNGATLLDVACGGGLLAPHVTGYRHVGVDLGESAARIAREHGVTAVRGDVTRLPVRSESVDVVVAGECFEHVPDLAAFVAEIGRVLAPGGTLVCDTLADTRTARTLMVTVAERLPFVPAGIHDPALFVDPRRLQRLCAANGIELKVRGLRPSFVDALRWQARRTEDVRMLPMRWTGVLYQGVGVKR